MISLIHVHFVPRWPKNPYHELLAKHLAELSIAVSDQSRLKEILHDAKVTGTLPEIVHLHALPPFRFQLIKLVRILLFWTRVRRLQKAGVKVVWTVHDIADPESMHPAVDRLLLRWYYRAVDAVIVHSLGAKNFIETQWQVQRRDNVYIVPHGHFIDCYPTGVTPRAARARLELPETALVFLLLGNIRPYKGVSRFVQIFKATATPAMRLVIAGEPLTDEIRREVEDEIDGCDLISFRPGYVANDDVQNYMAAADVVVFPYTKALTSGALILAMSFGRACIAPRMGALGDTLDSQGGFLYDPSQANDLEGAVRAAIEKRSQLPAMGMHNRTRAERWSWNETARQTSSMYRACLAPDP